MLKRRNALMPIALCVALFSPSLSFCQKLPDVPSKDNVELATASQVGQAVQDALVKANASGLAGLRLTKAVLSLQVGSSIQGGVKLNFVVFTIGHTSQKGETVTQTLTFGALDKSHAGGKADLASLTDSLSVEIATAAAAAAQIHVLPLSQATVKVEFAVEKKTDGGLAFKVLGYDLSGSVNWDKTSKNSLEVTFAKQ